MTILKDLVPQTPPPFSHWICIDLKNDPIDFKIRGNPRFRGKITSLLPSHDKSNPSHNNHSSHSHSNPSHNRSSHSNPRHNNRSNPSHNNRSNPNHSNLSHNCRIITPKFLQFRPILRTKPSKNKKVKKTIF